MTSEKERIDAFLLGFKELENHLVSMVGSSLDRISFSRALNEVYHSGKCSVLTNFENYDFLRTAADIRNILSHENDACCPSENFLNHFLRLKEAIIHPLTCYSVCTKNLLTCKVSDSLLSLMKQMEYHSLSHVPVVNQSGVVIGVFSRATLFDYLSMNESFSYREDMTIQEFIEFLPIDNHLNEKYLFVSRDSSVDKVAKYLFKSQSHDKNVSLLLVTDSGNPKEKLLGVISVSDLGKYSL